MAEARELCGDAGGAAVLEERAARRAQDQGKPEAAAGFRLRGGRLLVSSGQIW